MIDSFSNKLIFRLKCNSIKSIIIFRLFFSSILFFYQAQHFFRGEHKLDQQLTSEEGPLH